VSTADARGVASLDDIEIVDAHHHFWDLDALYYPWLSDRVVPDYPLGDYAVIRRTYLPDDYFRDAAGHNVIATVHLEGDRQMNADRRAYPAGDPRLDPVAETAWVSGIAEEWGVPSAIVAQATLHADDAEEVLARHAAYPLVRGIRAMPTLAPRPDAATRGAPGSMQDPKWLAGVASLEAHGMSCDLRVTPWHLAEAAEVARAFPRVRFILTHAGLPRDRSPAGLDTWRTGMRALAACPNVAVKISGLCLARRPWVRSENGPIVRETIATFGVDRCMFASNYPFDRLRASFDVIYASFKRMVADLPLADRRKLFSENALRIYRIDPAETAGARQT
jgi:predicted TIM-barrel fold metal-dependent hydrolase